MKQSQTKELINQLSAAFSALIKHLWIKHKPSKNSLISSFWYLIFLIANGSIIAGLAFLFIKSDPDMAKLIFSTNQDSSTSSFWDIVASIGSLLAGLGTVGLLAFGWIKAGDWIKEAKHSRKLEFETSLAQTISKHAFDLQSYYNVYLIHKVIDGNMSDDQFFYKKLFNKYSIKIEESIVAAKTLVIIYHHENKQNYISGLNAQKLKILEEINDLFKLYEEKNHSNNIADLDKKLYEIGVENLQLCNFLKEISDEYFVSLSSSQWVFRDLISDLSPYKYAVRTCARKVRTHYYYHDLKSHQKLSLIVEALLNTPKATGNFGAAIEEVRI